MKKILITFTICCLQSFMFAQVPRFLDWNPVQTNPIQNTPPPINQGSLYNPSSLGRIPSKVKSTSVQKVHFGMMLGSLYNTDDIDLEFLKHYGDNAYFGSSGDIHQIRILSECSKIGGTFGRCTIDFYKGRFWKIVYHDIKNEPQEFANELENILINYSISDTNYEYQCGDTYIDFNGKDLRYTSESIIKDIVGY